jgi:hypothetical protein
MRHSKAGTGRFALKMGFVFFYLTLGRLAFSADVTLAWDPNSEPDLAGYQIHYGSSPGIRSTSINVGNQATYTVRGLGSGTYYFAVSAYNTSGIEGGFSNEVFTIITAPSNTSLTASPSLVGPGGSVTVSWSGVSGATVKDWIGRYTTAVNDGGYTTWKYTSSCSQSAGESALSSGSCTFTMPLGPGTYDFRLFANNGYIRLATSGPVVVTGGP